MFRYFIRFWCTREYRNWSLKLLWYVCRNWRNNGNKLTLINDLITVRTAEIKDLLNVMCCMLFHILLRNGDFSQCSLYMFSLVLCKCSKDESSAVFRKMGALYYALKIICLLWVCSKIYANAYFIFIWCNLLKMC